MSRSDYIMIFLRFSVDQEWEFAALSDRSAQSFIGNGKGRSRAGGQAQGGAETLLAILHHAEEVITAHRHLHGRG